MGSKFGLEVVAYSSRARHRAGARRYSAGGLVL